MMQIENGYAKKLKVVIVDKDEMFCKRMKGEIQRCLKEICLVMEVAVENHGWELLGQEETYDIYFISLERSEAENLKLAKEVRKKNVDSEIIFISMEEEFMRLSLCVKPIAYVRRNKLAGDLEEALYAFWNMWCLKHKKIIVLDSKKPCLIEPGEIKYCQSTEHYVKFYRRSGDYIMVRNSMKEIAKMLTGYFFVRIHVRNLVNMQYIMSLENNKVTLEDGSEFTISQTYRNAANGVIWKYFNQMGRKK